MNETWEASEADSGSAFYVNSKEDADEDEGSYWKRRPCGVQGTGRGGRGKAMEVMTAEVVIMEEEEKMVNVTPVASGKFLPKTTGPQAVAPLKIQRKTKRKMCFPA